MIVRSILNALADWQKYIALGKIPVLLVAALLYLLLTKRNKGTVGRLIFYGAFMTVLCIFPISATLLKVYQTPFYDYPWIFGLVPMTILIGLGFVCFWTDVRKEGMGNSALGYNVILAVGVVVILILCGRLAREPFEHSVDEADASKVVQEVLTKTKGDICLYAPAEILEQAGRTIVTDRNITLLYGRNMWDIALNAYSYDTYSEELEELYVWMEDESLEGKVGAEGEQPKKAAYYLMQAQKLGANVIVLPAGRIENDLLVYLKDSVNPGYNLKVELDSKYIFLIYEAI